ncbi:hypothetical protein ACU3L3_07550 [Priestia endophytica]
MKMFKEAINYIKENNKSLDEISKEIFMQYCKEAIEAYEKLENEKGRIEHEYKKIIELVGEENIINKLEEERQKDIRITNEHYDRWMSDVRDENKKSDGLF